MTTPRIDWSKAKWTHDAKPVVKGKPLVVQIPKETREAIALLQALQNKN